jgi:Ni,Fe-hydrogenase III small subunit
MSFSDGYVYNLEEYDNNYRNVYAQPTDSSFANTASQVTVHEATKVSGGDVLLETGPSTKLSSDREAKAYPVAAQSGEVVAIGDSSIFNSEWVQRGDNEEFVSAVVEYLVNSDKTPGEPAKPEEPERPTAGV